MSMKDLYHELSIVPSNHPNRVTDNTADVGDIQDMQGFSSLVFAIYTGTLADSDITITPLVEEGDASDLSDNAAVANADLIPGAEVALTAGDDNTVQKIGYRGTKRYVRLTLTPASNTGNADFCALAIFGHADSGPQTTQETT